MLVRRLAAGGPAVGIGYDEDAGLDSGFRHLGYNACSSSRQIRSDCGHCSGQNVLLMATWKAFEFRFEHRGGSKR